MKKINESRLISTVKVGSIFLISLWLFGVSFDAVGNGFITTMGIKPLIIIRDANRPSLSFDGSRVVAGPEIGLSQVYDVNTGRHLGNYKFKDSESEAMSPDGKTLKIFGAAVTTVSIDTGDVIAESDKAIRKDGRLVAYVAIFNDGGMTSKNISSDLDVVANTYPFWGKTASSQPAVIVGRLSDHSLIAELRTDDGFVDRDIWRSVVMTPNAKFVAASRYSETIKVRRSTFVWDIATGKVVLTLPFSSHWLRLSDDGSRLVTKESSDAGKIETWDVSTGRLISTISQKANGKFIWVNAGVISPDGKMLVTTLNPHFYFWDLSTGKYITSQRQDDISEGNVKSVAFSGDGKRIAVGSDTEVVTVWSVDEILKKASNK